MNFRNMIVISVLVLLSLSAFAQATFDDSVAIESTDSGTGSDTDTGSVLSPEPDSNPSSTPSCSPIRMDPDGTIHCTNPTPTGTTVPPQPKDDDDTDTGSSSGTSSSSSSSSSTGSGSSGAGGKPYVCNGVGFKLEEGMVCTGKSTESVFEGTCCSVPGTLPEVNAVQEPVETASEPVIEVPAEPEELVSSLPAGEVSALPTDDASAPATAPSTGLFGLLGNPQAVGLGFIILAVVLLAGYWYSEQQKK